MPCCIKCNILHAIIDLYVNGQRNDLLYQNALINSCDPVSFDNCHIMEIIFDNNCNTDLKGGVETQAG